MQGGLSFCKDKGKKIVLIEGDGDGEQTKEKEVRFRWRLVRLLMLASKQPLDLAQPWRYCVSSL